MKDHFYTLIFIFVAFLSFGSASCMFAANLQNSKQKPKTDKSDTMCVMIPNLSVQDTLYIKHEDNTVVKPQTWWGENKELIVTILGAVFSLIIGLVVAFYSARVNQKSNAEQYLLQHQTQLETEAKAKAKEIYTCIVARKRANTEEQKQQAVTKLEEILDKAELEVPDEILERAMEIYAYYVSVMENPANQDDIREKYLINSYIAQVKN